MIKFYFGLNWITKIIFKKLKELQFNSEIVEFSGKVGLKKAGFFFDKNVSNFKIHVINERLLDPCKIFVHLTVGGSGKVGWKRMFPEIKSEKIFLYQKICTPSCFWKRFDTGI